MRALAVLHQNGVHAIVHDGGVGEICTDDLRFLAGVTGFLAQFAQGGGDRIGLAGVHHAAGNFQLHGFRALPVLLDQHYLTFRREGDDVHPVGALEDDHLMLGAGARVGGVVLADFKNSMIANHAARVLFPFADLVAHDC